MIDQLAARGFRVRIVGFSRTKLREQEAADTPAPVRSSRRRQIRAQYIDPDEQPDVAALYGYQPGYDGSFVLTLLGEDGTPRPRSAIQADGQLGTAYFTLFLGGANERDITTGLKTVASAGAFKVYFTTGHGERDLALADDNGISRLFVSLDGQGIAVEPLPLAEVDEVPADASAVLIVGAWDDFTAQEVERLAATWNTVGGWASCRTAVDRSGHQQRARQHLSDADSPLNAYLWDEFGVRAGCAGHQDQAGAGQRRVAAILNTIAPHTIMSDVRGGHLHARRP